MATPTVRYFEASAGTGSSLLSVWMPKLQELLLDAGWTLEYADSDAIGNSVDPSTPAWDKTPAANTDAGVAVYRMPANGHATQWYVRLRPGWGANVGRVHLRGITVGTTHDGNGTVTNGSNELAPTIFDTTVNGPWQVAASEDGFVLLIDDLIATLVERSRQNGTVVDSVHALNNAGAINSAAHVDASAGVLTTTPPLVLACPVLTHASNVNNLPSLESQDASEIVLLGPYWPGGLPLFGPPRLAVLASPADVPSSTNRVLTVDGGGKTYRSAAEVIGNALGRWLIATE